MVGNLKITSSIQKFVLRDEKDTAGIVNDFILDSYFSVFSTV